MNLKNKFCVDEDHNSMFMLTNVSLELGNTSLQDTTNVLFHVQTKSVLMNHVVHTSESKPDFFFFKVDVISCLVVKVNLSKFKC